MGKQESIYPRSIRSRATFKKYDAIQRKRYANNGKLLKDKKLEREGDRYEKWNLKELHINPKDSIKKLNRKINSKDNTSKRALGDAKNKQRQSSNQVSKMHFRAGGSGANRVNVGMSSNDLKKAYAKAKRMNDKSAASVYSKELAKRNRKRS